MLIVYVSCLLTTLATLFDLVRGVNETPLNQNTFNILVALWMWFTLLFANFAESIAEGRGKAQASSLKKAKRDTLASLKFPDGTIQEVPSSQLKKGDVVFVDSGCVIPGDGTVLQGAALVDESAITGESAPVVREGGGDRSAVTGGTTVLTNQLTIQITQDPGKSFLDQMIQLVEGASRKKTPNELALNNLLLGLTMVFLLVVATLQYFASYNGVHLSVVVLVALLVCLIPTTIGGLLSAIGIAGMDRLVKRNILAMSGRAVEAAGNVDVLILDKTGTITIGNRMACEFFPSPGLNQKDIAQAAVLCSLSDLTPEGRSIVALGEKFGIPLQAMPPEATIIPFTAETRMSGLDLKDSKLRKGACDAVKNWLASQGVTIPSEIFEEVNRIGSLGGTPLVVTTETQVMGVVHLKDVVKVGIADRFKRIRKMGIKTIMVTGDNKLTAKAIAHEAGVDDYVAEARPEDKLQMIKALQKDGHLVAMGGDGTNDAPALAQADVGLVMNTGTQAAREAGNMLDLDSDPTKVIDVVEVGKQLLITRGALTTFSIANDVAKYFAILPALFISYYPGLQFLNVMALKSAHSAILSAVIFNALIIIALIPIALKGVRYRPTSVQQLLRNNVFLYGVGGLVTPFICIKAIDMILTIFIDI